MKGDADIAAVAGLIGDYTRARVLLALGDGRPLAAIACRRPGPTSTTG